MGTQPRSDLRARSKSAFDFGCSVMKRFCSRSMRDLRRARSIGGMGAPGMRAEFTKSPKFKRVGCGGASVSSNLTGRKYLESQSTLSDRKEREGQTDRPFNQQHGP